MVLGLSPVAVTSPSDFAPASSKEFLDIEATIECGFTLKRVRDMTRKYSLTCLILSNLTNQSDYKTPLACYARDFADLVSIEITHHNKIIIHFASLEQ